GLRRKNTNGGKDLKAIRLFGMAIALAAMSAAVSVQAQESASARKQSPEATVPPGLNNLSLLTQDPQQAGQTADGKAPLPDAPTPNTNPADPGNPSDQYGKQPKRILGIIPNYRAVSANTHLPPQGFKNNLWLATEDTFDYSDFIFVGGLAGIAMAGKSQPSFGQGAAGYGRYYWHIFLDGGIENYMTEAIVPAATKQDPRYYTLGKGGFFKRTGYALSRLAITRTNAGNNTFNLSEIVGAGAAAGI